MGRPHFAIKVEKTKIRFAQKTMLNNGIAPSGLANLQSVYKIQGVNLSSHFTKALS